MPTEQPILVKVLCAMQSAGSEDAQRSYSGASQVSNNRNINNSNRNSILTSRSSTIAGDTSHNTLSLEQQQQQQLRQDLARQLDDRLCDIGGPITAEWSAIKQFVSSEIQSNLGDIVRSDVESLMEHPQLRELVRRLQSERPDSETQSDLLDKMTAALLPKVRRKHRQFLDRLNRRVSQMLVQLMRNDQLATVIDDERLLNHLFKLASVSEDGASSRRI